MQGVVGFHCKLHNFLFQNGKNNGSLLCTVRSITVIHRIVHRNFLLTKLTVFHSSIFFVCVCPPARSPPIRAQEAPVDRTLVDSLGSGMISRSSFLVKFGLAASLTVKSHTAEREQCAVERVTDVRSV